MHGGLAGAAAHFCRCRPFGVMVRSRAGNDATSVEIGYLDQVLDVLTTKGRYGKPVPLFAIRSDRGWHSSSHLYDEISLGMRRIK